MVVVRVGVRVRVRVGVRVRVRARGGSGLGLGWIRRELLVRIHRLLFYHPRHAAQVGGVAPRQRLKKLVHLGFG